MSSAPILPVDVQIAREEVLRFLGYPVDHEPPERIARIIRDVMPEARQLAGGCGSYLELPVERAADVGLKPVEAEALVIGMVTVGPAIEARSKQLIQGEQLTRGLVMDAAGSAAAEEAADLLGALIVGSEQPTDTISCRLSPGYGRWKLENQPALFALLPHEQLGMSLTPTFMMVPRKSISFAMWLGAQGPIGTGIAGCARCNLNHCRYRREPQLRETEASS